MKQAQVAGKQVSAELRQAIQSSTDSIRTLARRHGLNPKTVAKWRRRDSIADSRAGPRDPRSSTLSLQQEAMLVAFRQHVRLPLDGCFQALRMVVPQLSRSSLHRCLQRHGISRLPAARDVEQAARDATICFDIGYAEIGSRKPYRLLVAVERRSRFVHAALHDSTAPHAVADFVRALIAAVPEPIASVSIAPGVCELDMAEFTQACAAAGIAVLTSTAGQRWNAEQLARMNRTITAALDATRRPMLALLQRQLAAAVGAYNARCSLDLLGGATPLQAIGPRPPVAGPERRGRTMESRDSKAKARATRPKTAVARTPRRAPDPASTREAILQAARRCLAHDGPEGLSLAEVARLAGVNRGTAYQHFKTRDQLISAAAVGVSEKLFQAVFGPAGAAKDRKVGSVDVAALSDRLANFAMDNPELCRAWLLNVLSSPEPARDLFWREYQTSAERFDSTALSQDNVDTEVLSVITLAGAFLWPVWARAQYGATRDPASLARRFAEESLRISMYGNLRPERYPEVAKRLAQRRPFHRTESGGASAVMKSPPSVRPE